MNLPIRYNNSYSVMNVAFKINTKKKLITIKLNEKERKRGDWTWQQLIQNALHSQNRLI